MPQKIAYPNIPPIKEFKDGSWTIVWHGKVSRNFEVPSEPLIEIHIRSHEEDAVIEVGVGQLPILKIGAHFYNKRLTPNLPNKIQTLTLPDVHISQENVQTITAWEKMEEGRYAINPNSLKIPLAAADTKCLAINYKGNPFGIIVPTSEIARFYYCLSTDLAHSAFWGEYGNDLEAIVNPNKCGFDNENNRAIVHLRQQFANDDAWTIGRILFSKTAMHGVQEIHNSLLRGLDTDDSGVFSCKIPFSGKTRWIAKGIQMGSPEKPRYLILQLQKCSHPFPFSSLQVTRDNDATQADPNTDFPLKKKKPYQRGLNNTNQKKPNQNLNSETETNKNLPITNLFRESNPFDYLEDKTIIKPETKEFTCYKSTPNKPKTPDPTGLGTGQGDYSKFSTNQKAKIHRTKGVGADLEMLTEAVSILSKKGLTIKILSVSEMPLSASPSRRQWAYLDSTDKRKRRVIIIQIQYNENHYYWIDIEQRRKGECAVGLLKSHSEIGDETLTLILQNLAGLKGIWEGSKGRAVNDLNIQFDRVLHTWNSAPKLANIIEAKIRKTYFAATET